ncbi:hypothetical protein SSTU70S_00689 [Stutzerimonas stutzeri]
MAAHRSLDVGEPASWMPSRERSEKTRVPGADGICTTCSQAAGDQNQPVDETPTVLRSVVVKACSWRACGEASPAGGGA